MASTAAEEIELLERVLLRFGCADEDEKLESYVNKFLAPVILKMNSPHEIVRAKVVEVLTHIKRRLTSRSQIQIPVESLLDQYALPNQSAFLKNFAIIFITMGYPRLSIETQTALAAKVISCEEKLESYQDKLFMLLLPIMNDIKFPDDPAKRKELLKLNDKPAIRHNFLVMMQYVLLLPYGVTKDHDIPAGMSAYYFKRIISNNWRAEELEKIKKGIVRFICGGVFNDIEIFILLVIASADTRFSVATPAIAELSKITTTLDFSDAVVSAPLFNLFSGNNSQISERKTLSCCARVRQKLLQYLIKCRGKAINPAKGIQVVFEGLYGANTNQKCKVQALQFAEILIKDSPYDFMVKVSKVMLAGITKVIGRESTEPTDVQIAAYSALAHLSRLFPSVINQDLKILLGYFNHLSTCSADLQSSIREALVAMAPAFAWYSVTDAEQAEGIENQLTGQLHLLLAMLADNAESKIQIVQNVTSVFLTTCYLENFAPARFLLLLIAGERNSLHENITTYLYGVSKRDHIDYNMLSSIDHQKQILDNNIKSLQNQRRVVLPSFRLMMQYVTDMANKRFNKGSSCIVVGSTKLPFTLELCEEILVYLRICLWYSAGAVCEPGDEKYARKLKHFITDNYKSDENNYIHQYLKFVQRCVEAKRTDTNLSCLYDLLNVTPELLAASQMHLLEPLSISLKDVSETMRIHVSQVYGILLSYGLNDIEFDKQISELLYQIPHRSLENKHGLLLVLGHAFSRKINNLSMLKERKDYMAWTQFVESIKIIAKFLCESQWLLVSAGVKCISMIGKTVKIPNIDVEIELQVQSDERENEDIEYKTIASTKLLIFGVVYQLLRNVSARAKIREEATKCLGYLAIGDGEYFTKRNLEKFLLLVKVQKDVALNIAISEAIVSTLCGYDVSAGPPTEQFKNVHCDDNAFEVFLNSLIRLVNEPNPHARQSCSVWLLAIVKHCSYRPSVLKNKQLLQFAFTELLSDDSEFVQDVASRGLGLVYTLSDPESQSDLANSLLDQLIGGKRTVNKVSEDTELFAEGMLGKTPSGGNITTYKELCSLASDLNQPDMIYQFMQLANHNATWTSKLGAAFGLQTLSLESKAKMRPYLGKIIPRLYRYKFDPTPKIQNSMISIWDSIVTDPKDVVEQYYWEIFREILDNLTVNEWRVRIACCLAVRELLKRPNGLRLRTEERKLKASNEDIYKLQSEQEYTEMNIDEVPEPELKELWGQLFRVMDDVHEGTRLAAQGTAYSLSKLCIVAASSDHGKSGLAVASTILPLLLDTGVTHTVPDIRRISIKTISEMIDSAGSLIAPHLASLIPCLLNATGELESTKLSYLSTRLGADNDAQEAVDTIRAEAAKSHLTTEAINKCVHFLDIRSLELMTPDILELIKGSVNMGTRIACAHFVCLISIRIGKDMMPLVGKYLAACFVGLKDRNATVRKYYASAIGHLIGIAKEQSIKNLMTKLDELYMESPSNRAVALTIQSINKRHHELLKDYMDCILPLVFFAMHEEQTEESKPNIELWKELWHEISPGDASIRFNLHVIVPKLEKSLNEPSWLRKAQAANAIQTIATRLTVTIEEADRIRLIKILLDGLQGRTFQGKEKLLFALAALCKGLNKEHEICANIIEAAMKECRKEEPLYRTQVLSGLGDILEELEADRFEEVYNMVWYILEKKDLRQARKTDDEDEGTDVDLTADERNKRAETIIKLKEVVCETLGKSWPKKSFDTQYKYQLQFAERCSRILKDSTRQVQVSLLSALTKFVERLLIFNKDISLDTINTENCEKKAKVEVPDTRESIVMKVLNDVLSAVNYVSGLPHTGLKKESLNIILMLYKRLTESNDLKSLAYIKQIFEDNLTKFQKDSAPEIRCRIKDLEEKFSKCNL